MATMTTEGSQAPDDLQQAGDEAYMMSVGRGATALASTVAAHYDLLMEGIRERAICGRLWRR
jgi:hypothetical protein